MGRVMHSERLNSPNLHVSEIRVSKANGFFKVKRARAISCLLASQTIEQASVAAQIGKRTLERWLSQADFQRDYKAAQAMLLDGSINVLRSAANSFAQTLVEISSDKSSPAVVRLAAACRGLEILLRVHGVSGLEQQIDQLELQIARLEGETR